jgi:holo-[acyl-carrier protein] synthase
MIKGIGIDIVEIQRIEKALQRTPRFQQRLFTEQEINQCLSKSIPAQSFAARFAAKEAVFKALGSGWELGWSSIEVVSNAKGQPQICLKGKAAAKAIDLGIQEIKISLTHSRQCAAAVAVAVGAAVLESVVS